MTNVPFPAITGASLAEMFDPDAWRVTPSRGLPGGRVKVRRAYGWEGMAADLPINPHRHRRRQRKDRADA